MKTGLLILPFLSLFIVAIGSVVSKAFPDLPIVGYLGWGLAAATMITWVVLDIENFKALFKRKGAKYGASSLSVVVLGLAVIVGVAVITSRPRFDKTFDVTKDKLNTLSDQSIKVIENINKKDAEVSVVGYFLDQPEQQKFQDLLAMYTTKGAKIRSEFVNPQKDPTRAMAEKITAGNTVVIKFGNQENRVTTFTEEKFTNGLMKVLKDKSKKVYFTKGHGEGQIKGNEATGFDSIVGELENNKYEVAELSLLEQAKVPDDADLVVIAGQKYDLKENEARMLDDYLAKGGALLVAVDAMVPVEVTNNLLQKYGLKFNNDLLILRPDDPRASLLGQNNAVVTDFDSFHAVTKDFAKQTQVALLMPNTRSISEVTDNASKLKPSLIAKTANIVIEVKDVKTANDVKNVNRDRIGVGQFSVLAASSGKTTNPNVADAKDKKPEESKSDVANPSVNSGKETRIVAIGSSFVVTNRGSQAPEHRDIVTNISNYLLQDEDFISIRPKDASKSTLNIATASATPTLKFISFIYPFLFLVAGIVFWLRRRQA